MSLVWTPVRILGEVLFILDWALTFGMLEKIDSIPLSFCLRRTVSGDACSTAAKNNDISTCCSSLTTNMMDDQSSWGPGRSPTARFQSHGVGASTRRNDGGFEQSKMSILSEPASKHTTKRSRPFEVSFKFPEKAFNNPLTVEK